MKTVELGMRFVTIGRAGENGVSRISIDVSGWVAEYPNGTGAIVYKRPDGTTYPLVSECADGKLYAVLGATDTAISGTVKVEAQWLDDGKIAKSATYECVIERSIGEAGAVPTYRPSWVDEVLQAAAGIGSGGGTASAVEWDNVQSKPDTFPPAEHEHDASEITGLAEVAISGSYNDLTDKPTIPEQADGGAEIDDTVTAADKTWSSEKITTEITETLNGTEVMTARMAQGGALPNGDMTVGMYRGLIYPIKNPKKKITRATVYTAIRNSTMTLDPPATLTIGFISGTWSPPTTGNVFSYALSCLGKGTAGIGEFNKYQEVSVDFDPPIDSSDDTLYAVVYTDNGAAAMLSANIDTDVSALSDTQKAYTLSRVGTTDKNCYTSAASTVTQYAPALTLYTKTDAISAKTDPIIRDVGLIDGRLQTLEASADDTNPFNVRKPDGGLCHIFNSITCIGDSLTAGSCEHNETGTVLYPQMPDYGYPAHMRRILGCTVNVIAQGGADTSVILGRASEFATTKADAYIIALGTNQISQTEGLTGQITDINTTDSTQTVTSTSVGQYGKIIQLLRAQVPKCKIFMVTVPYTRNYWPWNDLANAKIRAIAELMGCYVIDLAAYGVQYADRNEWKAIYYTGGHLNGIGYYDLAVRYMTCIDWIIRRNWEDFKQVQFIQTNYSYEANTPSTPDAGGGDAGDVTSVQGLQFTASNTTAAYFSTDYTPNSSTKIIVDAAQTEGGALLGARDADGNNALFVYNNVTKTNASFAKFGTSSISGMIGDLARHTLVLDASGITADDVSMGTFTSGQTVAPGCVMVIGNVNAGGEVSPSRNFSGTLYDLKIYDGNTLVHHYTPAKTASGAAAMLDEITGTAILPASGASLITALE